MYSSTYKALTIKTMTYMIILPLAFLPSDKYSTLSDISHLYYDLLHE